MAKFRSGKKGRVTVDDVTLAFSEWDAEDHGDDLDTTNFESNGKGTGLTGIEEANFNLKGSWDHAQKPTGDPPGLYPRDDLANVLLTTNTDDNDAWTFPIARILSVKNNTPVRGLVGFEASGKSNGDFTKP